MSGTIEVASGSDLVKVFVKISLKITRSPNRAGYRKNLQRKEEAEKKANRLQARLNEIARSLLEKRGSNVPLTPVEEDVCIFRRGTAGYSQYGPFLTPEDDISLAVDGTLYYVVGTNPRALLRLRGIPDERELERLVEEMRKVLEEG